MEKDNPDEVLETIRNDARRYVDEYVDYLMKDRKLAPKTVRPYFYGVKYWLEANGVDVEVLKDIVLPSGTRVMTEDRAPTKDELRQILGFAHIRDKAATEIAATSGLRLNTIATLKWGDMVLNPKTLYAEATGDDPTMPAIIKVKPQMGRKTGMSGRKYFTFITPEAKKTLLQYRAWRERKGEEVTAESPLIASIHGEQYGGSTQAGSEIMSDSLQAAWTRLLKKSGLDQKSHKWHELHFHTLRKFFETQCINAGVRRAYIEFWLGHKGEYLDDSYFRANLKEHVEEYLKVVGNLSLFELPPSLEPEETSEIKSFLRELKEKGMSPDQVARLMIDSHERREEEDCQRIVTEDELPKLLREGWCVVATLPSGKIVIENE